MKKSRLPAIDPTHLLSTPQYLQHLLDEHARLLPIRKIEEAFYDYEHKEIIGGFHLWECVKEIAEQEYQKRLDEPEDPDWPE